MIQHFKRDIALTISTLSRSWPVIILTGPRQIGKTTVLKDLNDTGRAYVSLDDLMERNLARTDPRMFLQMHPAPVLIDEIQYAPELFSCIKIAVDSGAAPGSFWLTGSQAFRMMELAQESLAGRAALLEMTALSQHEVYGRGENQPFRISFDALRQREATGTTADMSGIYERIWRGGMPAYVSGRLPERDVYYGSYLQTYLERDIRDLAPDIEPIRFADFIRAAACRTGELLNVADIARDVGVTPQTGRRWLTLLERSGVTYCLHPYSNNLLKRTVKAPKLYFFDTGLVAYLTRYSSPEILANGAINGSIFENHVVNEIRRSWFNCGKDCPMWYYRDFDQAEIDVVIESDGVLHPVEIKRAATPSASMVRHFGKLARGSLPLGKGALICNAPRLGAISSDVFVVPAWML